MEKESICEQFTKHPIRKLCANCNNPKEDHVLNEEDVSKLQDVLKTFAKSQRVPEPIADHTYSWLPPNCPPNRQEDYFKEILENKVPKYGTEGQTNRMKELLKQIPLTDVSEEDCCFVEPECQSDLKSHIEYLKTEFLKFGLVKEWVNSMPMQCPKCLILLDSEDLVVMSTPTSLQAYHPACFVCNQCKSQIVDLIHCADDNGKIYCIRHFSETLKKRCHACDELIFAMHYAEARNHYYHRDHLFCFSPECENPLQDGKGFEKNGELYCAKCYEEKFAEDCSECGERISADTKHVTYEDKCWHLECFTCENCGKTLSSFEIHNDKFYCVECYKAYFAPRCAECKQLFEGHVKIVKHEGENYHVDCFRCSSCKEVIGSDNFIPQSDKVYCQQCHQRIFGIKCARCKYAITDDNGIMYNKQPYHAGCFTCYSCSVRVANKPFKTFDGKWYCVNCYGKRMNNICQACNEPIYLGENDVMYSYDRYKWHSQCFVCKSCDCSLSDTVFAMRGSDLICKNCSSQEAIASAVAKSKSTNFMS